MNEIAPSVQAIHKRLEPVNTLEKRAKLELSYAQNEKWGPRQEEVRTWLLEPQSGYFDQLPKQ